MFRAAAILGLCPALWAVQQWGDAEKEEFLRSAKVVSSRPVGKGVTEVLRLTLSDGTVTHDAAFQSVDISQSQFKTDLGTEINFRDSWKFSVAAYYLDRMLGLQMVPPTIERAWGGKTGALAWWVDDVAMEETDRMKNDIRPPDMKHWNRQVNRMRVFDQLIFNVDRNTGNMLIAKDWKLWLIDHTRAFRRNETLRNPDKLTVCDRMLLENLKKLTREDVDARLRRWLIPVEIRAMLMRRDAIVKFFEAKGDAYLYDPDPR